MTAYAYQAVDTNGRLVRGELDATNEADLEQRLARLHLELIRCKARGEKRLFARKGKINRRDLITFCFHMEQLTRAGVPLIDGLVDLRDSIEHPRFKQIIAGLVDEIEGGKMLSEAMADHPGVFDRIFIGLVKSGELTGQLAEVFGKLADALKWQDELIAQMKKIVMYPTFVFVVVMAVTFFLMIYLVPQLVAFISNMGGELPFHTRALIATSDFFVHYWYIVLGLPPAIYWSVVTAARLSPKARYQLDRFKINVWVVGPIVKKIILARFANFLGMMYSAGVPLLDAINTVKNVAANVVVEEAIGRARDEIAEGAGFTSSFEATGLFPPLVIRMLRVGETTGALDTALMNVSYFYDRDVKEAIGRAQSMIEPTLTVVMGLLLGWIMLSVMGPIYDTISKIKA